MAAYAAGGMESAGRRTYRARVFDPVRRAKQQLLPYARLAKFGDDQIIGNDCRSEPSRLSNCS